MKNLKINLSLLSVLVFAIPSYSRPQGPPPLSTDVENCVVESIGSLSALDELSHEDRGSLLSSCGAEKPEHRPPQMQLSEEDQACLESKIGSPEARPSREEVDAAMDSCNIERPAPPQHKAINASTSEEIEALISKYNNSSNPGEQEHIKRVLKDSFYSLDNEDLKDKIRTFLVSKIKLSGQVAVYNTPATAAQ
ncbi:MAG: hypothetical protein VX642_06690 [Bdellovibrionota bacterium]|nr:hypothetical protein [Bdellovibrionota bacterium]